MSPGSYLSKHVEQIAKFAKIRSEKAKIPDFKLYRHTLQKNRTQLKNQPETREGQTSESNVELLKKPVTIATDINSINNEFADNFQDENQSIAIVFLDIETSGFAVTDDILQIAVKYTTQQN